MIQKIDILTLSPTLTIETIEKNSIYITFLGTSYIDEFQHPQM